MHTTQDFMQSFSPPKAYLEAAKNMEGRLLPEGSNEAVPTKVTLDAVRRVLHDAQKYGQQRFEAGRQQILSTLSDELQAEVLGTIDMDGMAMAEAVEATVEFKKNWDDRGLTCKRCGTKWLDDRATSARCPMCDEPTQPDV